MDATLLISLGLVALTFLLLATIFGVLIYSGLFSIIEVGAGKPPIENVSVVYKFGRGPYKYCGDVFTEVCSIAPDKRCFGVYYDDPKQVADEDLRWAVGTILAEGDEVPDPDLLEHFKKENFKTFKFPKVTNAVRTTFPFTTRLSIVIAIFRVYPRLSDYVQEHKLCCHPYLEIYEGETIHFMGPLAKQDEFYVPETEGTPDDQAEEEEKSKQPEDASDGELSFAEQISKKAAIAPEKEVEESKKVEMAAAAATAAGAAGDLKEDKPEQKGDTAGEDVKDKENQDEKKDVKTELSVETAEAKKSETPVKSKSVQDSGISSTSSVDSLTPSSSGPSSPAGSDLSGFTSSSVHTDYTETSTVTSFTDSSGITDVSDSSFHREVSVGTTNTDASYKTAASSQPADGNRLSQLSSDSETETSSFEEVKLEDLK